MHGSMVSPVWARPWAFWWTRALPGGQQARWLLRCETPEAGFWRRFETCSQLRIETADFQARLWELYLHIYFHNAGLLIENNHAAPDFELSHFGEKVFVEAVTVNPSESNSSNVHTGSRHEWVGSVICKRLSPSFKRREKTFLAVLFPGELAVLLAEKLQDYIRPLLYWQQIQYLIRLWMSG